MALDLGDIAPNFVQQSTAGEIDFHAWLGATAKLKGEFTRRNVKVLGTQLQRNPACD
jgi:hypothetical protein